MIALPINQGTTTMALIYNLGYFSEEYEINFLDRCLTTTEIYERKMDSCKVRLTARVRTLKIDIYYQNGMLVGNLTPAELSKLSFDERQKFHVGQNIIAFNKPDAIEFITNNVGYSENRQMVLRLIAGIERSLLHQVEQDAIQWRR